MLGELVEDVALILAAVAPPQETIFFCVFIEIHAGVVAGGQIVVPQQQRPLQKSAEFQAAVAVDAGVGSAAGAVFGNEVIHYVAGKALRFIEHIKLHAQSVGHAAGVGGVIGRAAGALHLAGIQPQHGAVAGIALLHEQQRGGGAIHPAGHGHQYFFLLIHCIHIHCPCAVNPDIFPNSICGTGRPQAPSSPAGSRRRTGTECPARTMRRSAAPAGTR